MGLYRRGIPMLRSLSTAPTVLPPQPQLILPLQWGETPLVRQGEPVNMGQKVADGAGDTVPLHAPVSGTVAEIAPRTAADGREVLSIVLNNDGENRPAPSLRPRAVLDDLSNEELLALLYESGVRLPDGTPLAGAVADAGPGVETLIVSAMDVEPSLCAEDAVLCFDGECAGSGIRVLERLLHPQQILLAAGKRQRQAVAAAGRWLGGRLRLAVVPDRYPDAHPRLLAEALAGVRPGQTPRESGVLVVPVSAAAAAGRALYDGIPAIRQTVCVAWDGGQALIAAPVGVPVAALLRAAGRPEGTLLMGGPMTGSALENPQGPLTWGMTGLTVLPASTGSRTATACIRCGRCAAVCPMDLRPWLARPHSVAGSCIGCGVCQYVCPAALPLVEQMRPGIRPAAPEPDPESLRS